MRNRASFYIWQSAFGNKKSTWEACSLRVIFNGKVSRDMGWAGPQTGQRSKYNPMGQRQIADLDRFKEFARFGERHFETKVDVGRGIKKSLDHKDSETSKLL
jgi:hypothetical protein